MHSSARSWAAGDNTGQRLRGEFARHLPLRKVEDSGAIEMMEHRARTGIKAILTYQGKTFLLLMLTWIAFGLYIRPPPAGNEESLSNIDVEIQVTSPSRKPAPANLHLLVPASRRDPNVCKLIVSAGVAGYPSPILINWDRNYEDERLVEGEAHLAKIRGVHDYLQTLDPSQDEDLVVMLDGLDAWFQLKAQTLIKRYFDINRRANDRIASNIGSAAAAKYGIRQETLFGARKSCAPWTVDDAPCFRQPLSSSFDPASVEPSLRYINSDVAIGNVRAMRKLYKQALAYLPDGSDIGSDQNILARILSDQEVWREIVRRDSSSWSSSSSKIDFSDERFEEVRTKAAEREDGNFEFGVGLDFEGEIAISVEHDQQAAAWINHDDQASQQADRDIRTNETTTSVPNTLAPDILTSPPPFWTFNYEPRLQTSRWISWSNVSLLTNRHTGIVPAIIHHNGHDVVTKDWGRMWFAPHVRTMYDLSVLEPIIPVASAVGFDATMRRDYWPSPREKGGARNWFEWMPFDQICNDHGWHEEIFGDRLGPYIVPEHP